MTRTPPARPRPPRGMTLVIAMLMLLVIGLTAVAVMRQATTADKIAANARLRAQAAQFAQVALQFCARQIAQATPEVTIHPAQPAVPAWTVGANWLGQGPQPAYTLSAGTDFNGSGAPPVRPQCLVERTALADVYSVAARGFSPDFVADSRTGAAAAGAVVWLQSTVYAPAPARTVVSRTWQQIVTPPL